MMAAASIGSSPRLRGTYGRNPTISAGWRFIPAPAGNILAAPEIPLHSAVHPRACGEHGLEFSGALVELGSSPRLRGTLTAVDEDYPYWRFIPAPAGNIFTFFDFF